MLSGLPGRWVLMAVFIGFIEAFLTMRAGTGAAAVWTGALSAGAYFAMTAWQGAESWLLFWIMHAVVRARSGIVAEHTRKASLMQACWSSEDCAKAAVESVARVKAAASVMRIMEVPSEAGAFGCPRRPAPGCPSPSAHLTPRGVKRFKRFPALGWQPAVRLRIGDWSGL